MLTIVFYWEPVHAVWQVLQGHLLLCIAATLAAAKGSTLPTRSFVLIQTKFISEFEEYGHESNHKILRFWSKLWKNVVHFRSNVISPSHLCQVCVAHCSDIAEVLSGSNKCILYFSDKPHLYSLLLLVALGMRMMFFLGIQILLQTSVSDVLLQSLLWPELGDFLVTLSDWVSLLQPQNITFYGLRIYFQIRTI